MRRLIIAVTALLLCAGALSADTIYTTDGRVLRGEIVSETDDYVAVRQLHAAFADIVTRAAWAELGELFADDAAITVDTRTGSPIELVGPAALVTLTKKATEGLSFFQFVILNSRLIFYPDGDHDSVVGRLYIVEIRCDAASG